jgi:hypothetical protein
MPFGEYFKAFLSHLQGSPLLVIVLEPPENRVSEALQRSATNY